MAAGTLLLAGGDDQLFAGGDITVGGGTLDLGGNIQRISGRILLGGGVVRNGSLTSTGLAFDGRAGSVTAVLLDDSSALLHENVGCVRLRRVWIRSSSSVATVGVADVPSRGDRAAQPGASLH